MINACMDEKPGTYQCVSVLNDIAESFPFYCTGAGKYNMGEKYFTKRDGLDEYLLIITIGGCGQMFYRDRNCTLKKNSAVMIDCNMYHEYATAEGGEWQFYYLHFKAASLKGYEVLTNTLEPVILATAKYCCNLIEQIYSRALYMDMLSYAQQSNAISNLLTELLRAFSDTKNKQATTNRNNLEELAEYIRGHCTESLHLDDFSRLSNISKHHLIRMFQKRFSISPYKYVHLCRINLAQVYLLNTSMTIAEISREVGYSDTGLFIRHFKAVNGISPGQYRLES